MGRPVKEKSLTQQDVIAAAIACLDKEGEVALGVNRVARELGIKPPAIYKHLDGNTALRRAVALTIWQQYIEWCQQRTDGLDEPQALLRAGGRATRDFARSHPERYRAMTQFQLNFNDPETAPLIQEVFSFLKRVLQSYNLSETKLIDAMRIVNAAITGFIAIEQAGLMTLERSTDASYEVMLDALAVAIQHIEQVEP
ncbi:TetR/AcrR family transcriptional regulator [Komarekiella sp. 'clone 1']|uniref:TetR/AcrR family transcriptional regulator n=1 Tax=Komarekiella delphini-convector SJRDD-AB1 TaxID=2593771 RepID=A0AA40SXH0_9NOST|nr:TetR/AcrR family transcriptional regulator [Komarekiella delphini-convector]MBD6617074.1 TetR/AcrR family transcriptional regulator [Komarekiella delphini-convector SJRDD-AB1]